MGLKEEDTTILDKTSNCCNGVAHRETPKNEANAKHEEKKPRVRGKDYFEETPLLMALSTYLSYVILGIFGHIRDFMRSTGLEETHMSTELDRKASAGPFEK
ncbi:hypothetical protein HPB50_015882 [Hyalomma asiaticum]|uniref:Uncharacterized protein n=1 Tax=Hyalomma asiaticum TaxID=266040 RepID=A0ACB7RWP2_HYAAI|nr:hypothetical protein HPB50_015882 [Hyalomma asiaticum]